MRFAHLNIRFGPRVIPTLAALSAGLLTLYLGHWQQGRAAEKRTLQAVYEARAQEPPLPLPAVRGPASAEAWRYRRAIAEGSYDAAGQIFIDNKVGRRGAGYHVVTPFRLAGTSQFLLVNRGYVPRGPQYPDPPRVEVPSGERRIHGTLVLPSERFVELSTQTIAGAVWQNLSIARYVEHTRRDVLPYVLLLAETPTDRPSADGPEVIAERPDARVEKHVEYMLTWYSLAFTVAVLWVALNLKITLVSPDP